MTPQDRYYLLQLANALGAEQRFIDGKPVNAMQICEYDFANPNHAEGAVYIQISHEVALEAAAKLGMLAVSDRACEDEESDRIIAAGCRPVPESKIQ